MLFLLPAEHEVTVQKCTVKQRLVLLVVVDRLKWRWKQWTRVATSSAGST